MHNQRQIPRYKLKDGCIIIHDDTVGTINDISTVGLSCHCLKNNDCYNGLRRKIDILCKQRNILAEGLQVKILETQSLPGNFLKELETRKCRIMFEHLTTKQVGTLQKVLASYACA